MAWKWYDVRWWTVLWHWRYVWRRQRTHVRLETSIKLNLVEIGCVLDSQHYGQTMWAEWFSRRNCCAKGACIAAIWGGEQYLNLCKALVLCVDLCVQCLYGAMRSRKSYKICRSFWKDLSVQRACLYLFVWNSYTRYTYMHTQIVRTVKYIYDREDQRILINSVMLQKCGWLN